MAERTQHQNQSSLARAPPISSPNTRSYVFGFGSRYHGAFGPTNPISPNKHDMNASAYDWGHVRVLNLGQKGDATSNTAENTSEQKIAAENKETTAPTKADEEEEPKRERESKSKPSSSGTESKGSQGLKKGFLLRTPPRKSGKADKAPRSNADQKIGGNENEAKLPAENGADSDQDEKKPAAATSHDPQHVDNSATSDNATTAAMPPTLFQPPHLMAAGSTFTVYLPAGSATSPTIMQVGTMHGTITADFVPRPLRLPLKCLQLSCGRRHVLALMGDGPGLDLSLESGRMRFDGPLQPVSGGSNGSGRRNGAASPVRSAFESLSTGVVMSWGAGHFGQLGHGPEITDSSEPLIVEALLPRVVGGPVIQVSAGPLHSAAIVATSSSSTRAFMFGSNRRGQCGVEGGKCNTVPLPKPVIDIQQPESRESANLVRLALGRLHTVGLSESGEVYSWGSNTNGRCGHGDSTGAAAAKAGKGIRTPRRIDPLKNVQIIQIAAGDGHSLALTGSGRVFAWGTGSEGQLGQGHCQHLLSPRLMGDLDFAGIHSTYDSNGKLLPRKSSSQQLDEAAATSENGEFRSSVLTAASTSSKNKDGKDEILNTSSDVTVGIAPALPSYLTASAEAVHAFQQSIPDVLPPRPPKIVRIFAAGDYSCALSSSGDVYTCGYGDGNQLGHAPCLESGALPYVEPGPQSRTGAGHRIRDSCSFDSRLNVLLPRRVECTREMGLRVDEVCVGPGHLVLVCSPRVVEETLGLTLYEIEQRRRSQGLSKLRLLGSSRRKVVESMVRKKSGVGADHGNAPPKENKVEIKKEIESISNGIMKGKGTTGDQSLVCKNDDTGGESTKVSVPTNAGPRVSTASVNQRNGEDEIGQRETKVASPKRQKSVRALLKKTKKKVVRAFK